MESFNYEYFTQLFSWDQEAAIKYCASFQEEEEIKEEEVLPVSTSEKRCPAIENYTEEILREKLKMWKVKFFVWGTKQYLYDKAKLFNLLS